MAGCARHIKRVTLELGGKNANIVFADADLERAAATAPYAVFDNAGQDCCARSRILVQRSVLDRFMELLEPAVKKVAVGDPAAPGTEMGPLISAAHRQHVASYVPDGAPVAFRGSAPDGPGFWFPPTVLAPVGADDPAYTEEVFGPVVTVTPFEDEADAVAIANDTPYGLSGSIWTSRRRPRDPGGPGRGEREPVGELALVGALLDPVRRVQAVRAGPRARARRAGRVHRDQERLHRHGLSEHTRMTNEGSPGMQRLQDRVAVITGAGSGIGLASARRLAAEGAVVVAVDIDDAAGKAAAERGRRHVHRG